MIFVIYSAMLWQKSQTVDSIASSFVRAIFPHKEPVVSRGLKRGSVYDGISFDFQGGILNINQRTNEVVICLIDSTATAMLPKISPESYSDKDVIDSMRKFRPNLVGSIEVGQYKESGYISFRFDRLIDGVKLNYSGDSHLVSFDEKNGELKAFRFPPTEAGIHRISKWMPGEVATQSASRVAFDVFKGATQLNFEFTKKTYVGNNWFMGRTNPYHRAFSDPAFKDFLFPCYVVRYIDADSIRKGDGIAMQYVDVFIDAENGTLFGAIPWSFGGVGESAKSLDHELFNAFKVNGGKERSRQFELLATKSTGTPMGDEAILYGKLKIVKVKIDQASKIIWRGNQAYITTQDFWKPQ